MIGLSDDRRAGAVREAVAVSRTGRGDAGAARPWPFQRRRLTDAASRALNGLIQQTAA